MVSSLNYKLLPFSPMSHSVFNPHGNMFHVLVKNEKGAFIHDPSLICKRYVTSRSAVIEYDLLVKLNDAGVGGIPIAKSFFRHEGACHVVMTRAEGGDLFDIIAQNTHTFTKSEVKEVAIKLCQILANIHQQGVTHMDVKLENMVYDTTTKRLTLIDFDQKVTPQYCAPEWSRETLEVCPPSFDMWCVGMALLVLIFKVIPNKKNPLASFTGMSERCHDFFSRLFCEDPTKRMTAREALAHPWLSAHTTQEILVPAKNGE